MRSVVSSFMLCSNYFHPTRLLPRPSTAVVAGTIILAQVAKNRTAHPAFECPKRHGAGVLGVEPLLVVHASWAVQPKVGDGDAMYRRVKLPITVFRSAHPPGGASRPLRNRRQTGMLRERGLIREAGN